MAKVTKIDENNNVFDSEKILKALILREANPLNSISYIGKNEKNIDELCKRANIERREDGFYINGELITTEMQIHAIASELCQLAGKDMNSDLYFINMVKNILKEKVLSKKDSKKTLLSVDDLMKGLYGIEEEKVEKSL